jgi:hypothetical protein
MSVRAAISLLSLVCLTLTPTLSAQKGGKPKPTNQGATALFRCNGPNPPSPGTGSCGAEGFIRWDSITGDGSTYVGTGDLSMGSVAYLRSDGEFVLELRDLGGRFAFLDFRHVVSPPTGFHRKTWEQTRVEQFHLNTNALDPSGQELSGGLNDLLPGETRPARIKAYWTDQYGVSYTIRFNAAAYIGSTNVSVTRDSANQWTIEASEWDIAQLVSPPESSKGKPTGPTDEGFYHLPFKITFTVP